MKGLVKKFFGWIPAFVLTFTHKYFNILRATLVPSQLWSLLVVSLRLLLRMTVNGRAFFVIQNFNTNGKCIFCRAVSTTVILSDSCRETTTKELSREGTRTARNTDTEIKNRLVGKTKAFAGIQPALLVATLFLLLLKPIHNSHAKELNIVVTINPIYSLVSNVLGSSNNMHLLIGKDQSPHDYQIRPSDVRKLNQADIIFTIGDGFETFLFNYVHKSSIAAKVIKLSSARGLKLLPIKGKGPLHINHDDHEHLHNHCYDKSHRCSLLNEIDWHFWANVDNAKAIVNAIAEKLAALNPDERAKYFKNARQTIEKLNKLNLKIEKILKRLEGNNFIAMHDGYQYIERRYRLSNVGTVVMDKNFLHSARKLERLKKIVHDRHVKCMFIEPQTSSYVTDRVAKFLNTQTVCLDVEWGTFGQDIAPEDLYFFMMERNAENIRGCLKN